MKENIIYIPIVSIKQVRQSKAKYNSALSRPDDIVDLIYPMIKNSDREAIFIIGVDIKNIPNVINKVSVGTLNYVCAIPRDIFKPLILSNCASFFLIHNHVSYGDICPSEVDKKVTSELYDSGKNINIILLDHIIIGQDKKYYSFQKAGLLTTGRTQFQR